ncbi:ATP25 [Candida margitis]|uniref:ATP25 n=1 Tax=Candida margitis TaxID=1775924 RepID=UPI002227FF38|nr:ATP25 [Candida margitis]KAI5967693.1 ATP25 [Candida margitis]
MTLRLPLSTRCLKDRLSLRPVASVCQASRFSTTFKVQQADPEQENSMPWYLRKENSSKAEDITHEQLPELPNTIPNSIKDLLKLLTEKYGLTSLNVYDLASLPQDHPKHADQHSSERFIIIASGKSEKHIYKASYEIKQHIKHNFGYLPLIEGMTSNSISSRTRKRLAKRARQGPPATHNTFGIGANSWVRCDLGVDGAVVHILSDDRRSELDLESLYQENVTGEAVAPQLPRRDYEDTGSVFYGLRRNFHTFSKLQNAVELHRVAKACMENIANSKTESYKTEFNGTFTGSTVQEWAERFAFYKNLYLANPMAATFADVEQTLLDKHSSAKLLGEDINWNQEIVNDVIKYMELLLDMREPLPVTEKLARLSSFISSLTTFSRDEIHFFAVDKFQALLWSLTCDGYISIDAARLHTIIQTGDGLEPESRQAVQDLRAAQNVRELLRTINFDKRGAVPLWLREQMLYTYANARNWDYFWKEWDTIQQSLNTPAEFLDMQAKTIVLLAMINDRIALRDFFGKFWDSSNSQSFMNQWKSNGSHFNTEQEKLALKRALTLIHQNHGSTPWLENARVFATTL